jgi:hypothetical protein
MAFCAQLFANWATTQEEKHPSLWSLLPLWKRWNCGTYFP